jgi:hypothetical protein
MNSLDYYYRQKEVWEEKEIEEIRNEYLTKKMTISEIGDFHHRTPGSIGSKLHRIGLIRHNAEARGYNEYKDSKLYKEIVESSTKKALEKKEKKDTTGEKNSLDVPSRKGEKWEDYEINKMLLSIKNKKSISDIATEHERTIGGINSQRRKLAANYYFKDKISIDEIIKFTGLTREEVEDTIKRRSNSSKAYNLDKSNSSKNNKEDKEENLEKTDPIVRSGRLRNRDAIQEIRSEIHTLKQDVKEILRLMNALYDFESQ